MCIVIGPSITKNRSRRPTRQTLEGVRPMAEMKQNHKEDIATLVANHEKDDI